MPGDLFKTAHTVYVSQIEGHSEDTSDTNSPPEAAKQDTLSSPPDCSLVRSRQDQHQSF